MADRTPVRCDGAQGASLPGAGTVFPALALALSFSLSPGRVTPVSEKGSGCLAGTTLAGAEPLVAIRTACLPAALPTASTRHLFYWWGVVIKGLNAQLQFCNS